MSIQIVTLKIDGRDVSGREDQTVLEVAQEHQISIPKLCKITGLSAVGACRLCLVEIEGVKRPQPACVTRVAEGMSVRTDSDHLRHIRRIHLELLFAERNHVCSVCVSNGNCELQDLAQRLGVDHVRYPNRNQRFDVDASHDRFVLDHNRCVLCSRCVRICDEIEGAHTWDMMGRGAQTRVVSDLHQPWGSSTTCTSCGKCVQVCPTGALAEKGRSVAEMAKQRSFLPYLTLMREKRR